MRANRSGPITFRMRIAGPLSEVVKRVSLPRRSGQVDSAAGAIENEAGASRSLLYPHKGVEGNIVVTILLSILYFLGSLVLLVLMKTTRLGEAAWSTTLDEEEQMRFLSSLERRRRGADGTAAPHDIFED